MEAAWSSEKLVFYHITSQKTMTRIFIAMKTSSIMMYIPDVLMSDTAYVDF
jgi:hypothetical protein